MKSKKYLWLMSLLSVGTITTTITAFSCSNSASSENSPENKPPVTPEQPTPPVIPEEPKPPVIEPEVPANPTKVISVNDISKESNGNVSKFKLEILGENLSLDYSKYELYINNVVNKWAIDNDLSNSNKVILYTEDRKFENAKAILKIKDWNNENVVFTQDLIFGKFITTEDRINELKSRIISIIEEKNSYINNIGTAQSFADVYTYFNDNKNYNEGDIIVNHTMYLQNPSKSIKDNSYFSLNTNIKCEDLNINLETYKFINPEVINEATNNVEYKTDEGIVFKNNEIIRYEGTSKEINITMSLVGTDKEGIKGKSGMITIIGDSVFSGKSINKVTLSSSIKVIGKNAFSNNNITELKLPASLIELGAESFKDNKIQNLSFQYVTELITISNSAFENNLIESISSWGNVSEIGDYAFKNNKIYNTGLNLDESRITRIGIYAFAYNLIQLNIGGGQVQKIIKLPATLTHLGVGSFEVSEKVEYFGGADAKYDFFELGDRGSDFFKNISVINTDGQIRKYVTLEYFNVRIVNNEYTWQDVDIDRPIY